MKPGRKLLRRHGMAEGQEYDPESIRDDDEVRSLYLEEWLVRVDMMSIVSLLNWIMPAALPLTNGSKTRAMLLKDPGL